jgi:hypothetical protein
MAKKVNTPPPVKKSLSTRDNDINILKRQIKHKVIEDVEPIKEEPIKVEAPNVEATNVEPVINESVQEVESTVLNDSLEPVINEPAKEVEPTTLDASTIINTEPVKATSESVTPKRISLFGNIQKPTEQDKEIKDALDNPLEETTMLSSGNEMLDDDNYKKQTYIVKASVVIEIIDVVFAIVCMFMTSDFSEENQKVYSLGKDRKRAIQTNLVKIYVLDNKKVNPKKDIYWLILGSYAPLLVMALFTMLKKIRDKRKEKENKQAIDAIIREQQEDAELLRIQLENERQKNVRLTEKLGFGMPKDLLKSKVRPLAEFAEVKRGRGRPKKQ